MQRLRPCQALDGLYRHALGLYGQDQAGIHETVVQHDAAGAAIAGIANGSGLAGRFVGNVNISGNLSKGGGGFKIDHPLDPANRYLYHSFVESPDMMNIYNGNATLDANGETLVDLPNWFDALNRDFRYQLTAIGAPGPNLYIADEVSGNRFHIAGGKAGMEVSWQVTGIRRDAFANLNRIPVEEPKVGIERGKYLHPKAFGMPASMSAHQEKSSPKNGVQYKSTME